MIDELEVKGLDISDSEDAGNCDFQASYGYLQDLINIFYSLDVVMNKNIILIIHNFCKPGIIWVHTRDNNEFALSTEAVRLSQLLSIQAELSPSEPIHLSKCLAPSFHHVSKYLNYHRGVEPASIEKPIRNVNLSRIVEDPEDVKFANNMSSTKVIFQVILDANYIDCKSLVHLMCAKIATMIKGKGPAEIQRILSGDTDETDNESQQNPPAEPAICMCGYVWQEEAEAPRDDANAVELEPSE